MGGARPVPPPLPPATRQPGGALMRAPMTNRKPAVEHPHTAAWAAPGPARAGQRPHGTPAPAYQDRWTRLGRRMGYTNTAGKRAAIRAAVDAMIWVDPDHLADLLQAD